MHKAIFDSGVANSRQQKKCKKKCDKKRILIMIQFWTGCIAGRTGWNPDITGSMIACCLILLEKNKCVVALCNPKGSNRWQMNKLWLERHWAEDRKNCWEDYYWLPWLQTQNRGSQRWFPENSKTLCFCMPTVVTLR